MSKKNKNRNKQHNGNGFQPVSAQLMPRVDMGFLNASIVQIPDWKMAHVILVGCGGIGAYAAQHIGRIMHCLYRENKGIHLTLVDPDVVEEANIGRQLFCAAEIGQSKAEALVRRYGHAWGLNCSSYVGRYDESLILGADITILVGCVDNAEARKSLHETLRQNEGPLDPRIWWLDAGNLYDTGRVLFGSAYGISDLKGAFMKEGQCFALPSPALQSPGLLQPQPEELPGANLSCAEMAMRNMQSLNINARIAAELSDFLTRALLTHDLKRFGCELNLAAGTSKSIYTTADEVARIIKKPATFLTSKPVFDASDIEALEQGAAADTFEDLIARMVMAGGN